RVGGAGPRGPEGGEPGEICRQRKYAGSLHRAEPDGPIARVADPVAVLDAPERPIDDPLADGLVRSRLLEPLCAPLLERGRESLLAREKRAHLGTERSIDRARRVAELPLRAPHCAGREVA